MKLLFPSVMLPPLENRLVIGLPSHDDALGVERDEDIEGDAPC
jgi:hypothetical protein